MKLHQIRFDDAARPEEITVTLSLAEAAAITRLFGALNDYGLAKLGLDAHDIYDVLTGAVLNAYWDNGVDDVLPERVNFSTLNQADKEAQP